LTDVGEKMGVQLDSQLLIDFKKAYDSGRQEELYNIPVLFGVLMELIRLIKMCLNETYGKVHIGMHMSDSFLVQNGLNKEMLHHHCFSTLL
jgi:hypothetical protein